MRLEDSFDAKMKQIRRRINRQKTICKEMDKVEYCVYYGEDTCGRTCSYAIRRKEIQTFKYY
jgi:hypothetical protein